MKEFIKKGFSRFKALLGYNFGDIYPDDTFLVSYPRSGNTWVRYVLSYLISKDERLSKEKVDYLIPDLYVDINWSKIERPRIIKSHEPYQERYPKIIYLVRDGRDVACSYYDYYCRNKDYKQSFSSYLKSFLQPSFDFGSWPLHVCGWLNDQKIDKLVVHYEELFSNTQEEFERICEFTNLSYNPETIKKAISKSTRDKIAKDANKERAGLNKGPGVWKEFFCQNNLDLFNKKAGATLKRAGYPVLKHIEDDINYPDDLK